jgi:hypothetical protein
MLRNISCLKTVPFNNSNITSAQPRADLLHAVVRSSRDKVHALLNWHKMDVGIQLHVLAALFLEENVPVPNPWLGSGMGHRSGLSMTEEDG